MLMNLMEGDTITTNTLISSIKKFNSDGKQHGTIKALLKNFILPETEMAIKENQNNSNNYIYTVPVKPPLPTLTERMKSINDAKQAFLNSTVSTNITPISYEPKTENHTVHYAQIAITTESEDTRSTGGGRFGKHSCATNNKEYSIPIRSVSPSIKKTMEQHQRKVSFKIKNATTSYKRPPLAKTMTITSSNVAELTKKFNNLQTDTHTGSPKQKLAKTLEELQSASRCSASNSSTPSSTLSSSPNIKIVLRQRRGSKKRNNRKRCSSMDSVDDLLIADSSKKNRVIRSKSDGNRIPKTTKKRLKYQDSSEQPSGSDSVDGSPVKTKEVESKKDVKPVESTVVKNVIKKFECEITAQTNSNNTLKRQPDKTKSTTPVKEKPKVPEKKSSLVLTKNLVVKDGIPKIKTIKPVVSELAKLDKTINQSPEIVKRKEPLYDRKRYKTNYIHSEKLPLKVVEIIPEDINESNAVTITVNNEQKEEAPVVSIVTPNESEKVYQEINSPITPNESFLWRRKSSTQIYSDSEKSDNSYSFVSVTANGTTITCSDEPQKTAQEESQVETNESQVKISTCEQQSDANSDFESNLVEACNKEIIIGFTSKPKQEEVEDYYEPLEPRDEENIVIIPIKSPIDRTSKINCPLPEIPKETKTNDNDDECADKDNIYQCLLEMRSHPEGDESSLHNYELCDNDLEERTRGDGDSDDGYEYCKSPPIKPYCLTSSSGIQIAEDYKPFAKNNNKNYEISKSVSGASTVSYEKIGPVTERIYEKIPARPPKSKNSSPTYSSRHSFISDYTVYNENENIYDTIKHGDAASLSHCYESIPNSPSMVKLRNDMRKQVASNVHKRLSFDTVSNISQSTMSSEQKTNSLYGQRSVISYNGQEIAFQVPSSETSVSDRSDRSDDWVDVSDEEKNEQKIIIVRERSRGRKSPISWSQKVRHQWQKSPKPNSNDQVFITSPTKVYIATSAKCSYYSQNDERPRRQRDDLGDRVRLIDVLERTCWLNIRTVLQDGEIEIQDLIAFFECDSSDSGHLYESLEPAPAHPHPLPAHAPPPLPLEEDFDSFDSDSDTDDHDKSTYAPAAPTLPASRLPNPPTGGGQYTLTKIASAAQKKMRQIKRNLTKRYSVAMDGKPFTKTNNQTTIYDMTKKKSPIYANCERPEPLYTNINFNDTKQVLNKTEIPLNKVYGSLKEELKTVISDKRGSNGDIPPPLPDKPPPEKPVTPTSEASKKDSGTLSRKAYFSFKSRFRRATSLAVDINSEVPSALKITNSTFYLTDSMDGDSGFSNCSDNGQPGSTETLSPTSGGKRRDGRRRLADSSPCLCAPARPALPPPPPPPAPPAPATPPLSPDAPATDFSAVNEELKRLLPTLSRKDKSPRARTSWYAECGADTTPNTSPNTTPNTSNTSWYAEAGLYQAGNISSSSGASSGSHPASPLPHSLFTHEPLYQFYNAAKVESVCRETGDSDSDAYEPGSQHSQLSQRSASTSVSESTAPARPSAMALVAPRGPSRTLWCEVPEVVNSAVLSSLAPAQKRLQEAKFELLTSEASYLNSLNVLEANFIAHPAFRDPHVMPRADWETLFSTILPVRKCSQLLMNELEKCWQDNILLQGICDIVRQHADQHFGVYVKYCENQALMVRALQRLQARPAFVSALKKLESHPSCQSLSLHSFLMLPMQRVTRLPLLMDAVLKNLNSEDLEYHACATALVSLNNYVSQCNEGARNTERIEEMYRLCKIIEFPPHIRDPPSLGPACSKRDRRPVRWLVRSGEMTQLIWKSDELKLTFGKKFHKVPLHLFLFNDLLVIAKKKSEELYVCVDHCPRSLLEVCASDVGAATAKHALLITLLENHEGRTLEMLMSCPSETEWSRWSEALLPPAAGAAGEAVYAGWDCPQVCALYSYAPAQPDELPLAEGDVVNVTRKTSEGWYYGERTRDGEAGWFPGAYTAEIASPHVRARNLRQRYRLLALSGTYLGQKKKIHV